MTTVPPEFAPVAAPARIAALDALRGLALLGILLSNVAAFAGPLRELHDGIDPSLRGGDYAWSAFVYVAIRDKAWTLFALLFGMGFASMLGRAPSAGRGFAAIYLRRSVGLLAIGLIHAWLIWAGDILVTYALCAFALLALRGWAPERWIVLGSLLYASGIGFMVLIAASLSLPGVAVGDAAHLAAAAHFRERLHRSADAAVERVRTAEMNADRRSEAARAAHRDQSAVEKLIDRHRAEVIRAEMKALEDAPAPTRRR